MTAALALLALALAQDPSPSPDPVVENLRRLAGEDAAEHGPAADALVKLGTAARSAIRKAIEAAKDDHRARLEAVLLRLEAGTDARDKKIGGLEVAVLECGFTQENAPDGKGKQWRVRARIRPSSPLDHTEKLVIRRGWLVMVKEKTELATLGPDRKPLTRDVPAGNDAAFEFGVDIRTNAKWKPGLKAVIVLELAVGKESAVLRSEILEAAEGK